MFNDFEEIGDMIVSVFGQISRDDVVAAVAESQAKLRDALIAQGFTREEAVNIIVNLKLNNK